MADEIRLVTFEGENVAPINDALMWDVAIGDSGVIYGCETTIKNASTLHIEAGYGVICGRHFQIFESDVPVTLSPGGDLLGRLYIHMDLSDASEPVQLLVETDASLTPEEQDANINIINGIWDMNLATFALNAVTISDLQNVFPVVAGGGSNLIAGTETGPTASEAYVPGQYIIWGSRLWEVIDAIAQGDQFVIGSNLSATSTTVGNELTELNSSLDDIDIRYNAVSGKPEWRERGAGTFVPFDSGAIKSFIRNIYDGQIYCGSCYIINEGGQIIYDNSKTLSMADSTWPRFAEQSDLISNFTVTNAYASSGKVTIEKEGYYFLDNLAALNYWRNGDIVDVAIYTFCLMYLGETNPFE